MTYDRDREDNPDRDPNRDLGAHGTKNETKGGMEKLKGKLEKGIGKLKGDRGLETKGTAHEAKGNVQKGVGETERKVDDLADE
jgi:uncharacterized protein YjbJ (UPF0337 family)